MPTIRTPTAKGAALSTSEAEAIIKRPSVAKAISYNLTAAHNREVHELANGITATLPTASGTLTETDDWSITLKAVGASATIDTGGQDVDGSSADITLLLNDSITLVMDAAQTGFSIATNYQETFLGALGDGTTATTQSAGDNSTLVATTAYVDTAAGSVNVFSGGGVEDHPAGATEYMSINGLSIDNNTFSSTETDCAVICPINTTLSKLYVKCVSNTLNVDTVFTLMIDGVASSITVTLASTVLTGTDLAHTEAVTAGQTLSMRVATGAGTGKLTRVKVALT